MSCIAEFFLNHAWLPQLFQICAIYSIILLPMAILVIGVKRNIYPFSLLKDFKVIAHLVDDEVIEDDKGERQPLVATVNDSKVDTISPKLTFKCLLKFLHCFTGFLLPSLIFSVLQERIMTKGYLIHKGNHHNNSINNMTETIYFTDIESFVFFNRCGTALIAATLLLLGSCKRSSSKKHQTISESLPSLYKYVFPSVSGVLASWTQNEALHYVNYPTQILSKSCKVIPVMLMSWILAGKKSTFADYLIAACLSIGMYLFLIGTQGDHTNELTIHGKTVDGVIILIIFLTLDSFTCSWQGKLFDDYTVPSLVQMFYVGTFSMALTFTSLVITGQFYSTIQTVLISSELTLDLLLVSISSGLGQVYLYYTISAFGPVAFVIIGTVVHGLSIGLSCFLFKHTLTLLSILGLVIVFPVLLLQTWLKYRKQ